MLENQIDSGLVLESDKVLLRCIRATDVDGYVRVALNPDIWTYFVSRIDNEQDVLAFVEQGIADTRSGSRFVFTIIDKASGSIVGSTSYGNISPRDGRLEIGWSWIAPANVGGHVNRHAKYLLMRHGFEHLKASRIEFKTDVLNTRARKALAKIGAVEEGVLRSHTLMPGGRRRDTIYYSVLAAEWSDVRSSIFSDLKT